MVKLSVEDRTISVTKAVEKEIVEFLNSFSESKEMLRRIYGWRKDFHIVDMFINRDASTVTLVRALDEQESTGIDIEIVAQAMRDIVMDFVNFISALIEESKEDKDVEQEPAEQEEYVSITRNEKGHITVEGNMHPLKVIALMIRTMNRIANEKPE